MWGGGRKSSGFPNKDLNTCLTLSCLLVRSGVSLDERGRAETDMACLEVHCFSKQDAGGCNLLRTCSRHWKIDSSAHVRMGNRQFAVTCRYADIDCDVYRGDRRPIIKQGRCETGQGGNTWWFPDVLTVTVCV